MTSTKTSEDGSLVVHAQTDGRPSACPLCGSLNLYVHGTLQQEILDIPLDTEKPGEKDQVLTTHIHLARKRWKCTSCKKTFLHPLSWLDEDHRSTERFIEHLAPQALEKNFSKLAREYGIHEKTVRNIFYRHYADVDQITFETPQQFGIGEMEIAGMPRAVMVNLKEKTAVEYLPKNSLEDLKTFFQGMDGAERVQLVVTGFAPDCRPIFEEFVPKAKVVIDRAYVVALADDVVESVRQVVRGEIKSASTKTKLTNVKMDKLVLRMRKDELTDWALAQLKSWRLEFPLIAAVYEQKEALYCVFDAANREQAKDQLNAWRTSIPTQMASYWAPALAVIDSWEDEILAYFDLYNGTNGVRSSYAQCQELLKAAAGQLAGEPGRGHSFDALRIKLLMGEKKSGYATGPSGYPIQKIVSFGVSLEAKNP